MLQLETYLPNWGPCQSYACIYLPLGVLIFFSEGIYFCFYLSKLKVQFLKSATIKEAELRLKSVWAEVKELLFL